MYTHVVSDDLMRFQMQFEWLSMHRKTCYNMLNILLHPIQRSIKYCIIYIIMCIEKTLRKEWLSHPGWMRCKRILSTILRYNWNWRGCLRPLLLVMQFTISKPIVWWCKLIPVVLIWRWACRFWLALYCLVIRPTMEGLRYHQSAQNLCRVSGREMRWL